MKRWLSNTENLEGVMKFFKKLYIVYDIDDNFIMEGTSEQVCIRLDIVKSTISKAVKTGGIVRRKYRIYESKDD